MLSTILKKKITRFDTIIKKQLCLQYFCVCNLFWR